MCLGILLNQLNFSPLKSGFLAEAYVVDIFFYDRVYHFRSNFPIYLKSGGDDDGSKTVQKSPEE